MDFNFFHSKPKDGSHEPRKSKKGALITLAIGIVLVLLVWGLKGMNTDRIPAWVVLLNILAYLVLALGLTSYFSRAKRTILANLSVLVVLIMFLELFCFFMLGMPEKEKKDFSLLIWDTEHISNKLGSAPFADSVYHYTKYENGELLWEANSTIDQYNRRATPAHDSTKAQHALFFGCSIAYGYGVEDNETMPYYFQQESGYNAYNYAYQGNGTQQMLARFEFEDLSQQVPEKEGVAVYVFFWDHMYRTIGAMSRYTKWGHEAPYYYLSEEGLVRDKTFKDGRYYTSKFYELIYQSNIIKYFNIDFPFRLSEDHYDLVSEIVLASKKKYKEQFGSDDFYVLIHPSYLPEDDFDFELFKSYLNEKDIACIDLFDMVTYSEKYTLKGDGHPNPTLNKMVAEKLIDKLAATKALK